MALAIPRTESPSLNCDDKVVCRLDAFPELLQALRDGDLPTGRLLCARLFYSEKSKDQAEAAVRAADRRGFWPS
jgi:hypothetical protein